MLTSMDISGIAIFRASEQCEGLVYQHIKRRVFELYPSGVYTDITKVTEIVNAMYSAYYQLLDEYLPKINHWEFAIFLVKQYELYGQVEQTYKDGRLSSEDEEYWQAYASHARRGIKHLLELLCIAGMSRGRVTNTQEEQEIALSILFIAGEELVSLYMRSDLYRSFLDEVTLVLDESEYVYFNVEQDRAIKVDVRNDVREAIHYIPEPNFLYDYEGHNQVLESSFVQKLGVNYSEALGCLQFLIERVCERDDPSMFRLILRREAIDILSHDLPMTAEQAEIIIDGFSLSAQKMLEEGRELFRPKQQHRAYKRGFFVVPGEQGDELFFSRRMASECLQLLLADITFRKIPPEWESTAIREALNKLSIQAGKWFEQVVKDNLNSIGIRGITSVERLIFNNGLEIKIPAKVGEIDFIGLCSEQKMLVVVEVKQVSFSIEPRMYLDDLDKFVTGSKNYADKFEAKYRWAIEHHQEVANYLAEQLHCSPQVERVGYAMITHHPIPTFVARKISHFSCLSITEFMRRFKAKGTWDFSKADVL